MSIACLKVHAIDIFLQYSLVSISFTLPLES